MSVAVNMEEKQNDMGKNYPEEIEKFEKCAKLLRKIFIPINPLRLNLKDEQFSPFLQIEKYDSPFFYIPIMEAVINSRWKQAKTNWMIFFN